MIIYKNRYFILLPALLGLLTQCRKNEAGGGPVITDSVGKINVWIYDSMQLYYYWSDDMPASPDYTLATADFFKSLLSPKDRFSRASDQQGTVTRSVGSSFSSYGFHYAFIQYPGYEYLLGVVTYVAAESPADRVGLERGSCFTKVNGTLITTENMATLEKTLASGDVIALTPALMVNDAWDEQEELQFGASYINENPVVLTKYFTANGIKTGYLFYNGFTEQYDELLLQALQKLKQAGVTECILDMRYNPGGSVAGSAKLAAMLAPIEAAETYGIFQANRFGGRNAYSLDKTIHLSGNAVGTDYDQLADRRLPLSRLFILSSRATVSAAELLINNLRPYLTVIQVGDTTYGKDEASFRIEDKRNPREVQWVLDPIVYKLFNSQSQGGYDKGLAPDYVVDELDIFPLSAVGAAEDPLIRKALEQVYGTYTVSETLLRKTGVQPVPVVPVYNSARPAQGRASAAELPRPLY